MTDLRTWVKENCTKDERNSFEEALQRQNAIFARMVEAGEVISKEDGWEFTDQHQGHEDDAVFVGFSQRYSAAIGQV